MTEEESNKELEDWCDEFAKEFYKFCEEEDRRREEYNLVLGIIISVWIIPGVKTMREYLHDRKREMQNDEE